MGFIKTLLGIAILLAIVVFGYWLYATYTMASADDEIWVKVNSNLPDPLRKWACAEVNGRMTDADAPVGCGDVWRSAGGPQTGLTEPDSSIPVEQPADKAPNATGSGIQDY